MYSYNLDYPIEECVELKENEVKEPLASKISEFKLNFSREKSIEFILLHNLVGTSYSYTEGEVSDIKFYAHESTVDNYLKDEYKKHPYLKEERPSPEEAIELKIQMLPYKLQKHLWDFEIYYQMSQDRKGLILNFNRYIEEYKIKYYFIDDNHNFHYYVTDELNSLYLYNRGAGELAEDIYTYRNAEIHDLFDLIFYTISYHSVCNRFGLFNENFKNELPNLESVREYKREFDLSCKALYETIRAFKPNLKPMRIDDISSFENESINKIFNVLKLNIDGRIIPSKDYLIAQSKELLDILKKFEGYAYIFYNIFDRFIILFDSEKNGYDNPWERDAIEHMKNFTKGIAEIRDTQERLVKLDL